MRRAAQHDHFVDSTGEFPLSAPEYLFYLIFQTSRQSDLLLDRASGRGGRSLTQLRTLAVIRRIENCSMKDLALFSGVDRTTLTRAVDQLVRDGLVERWSPAGDRRRVIVSLSPEGEALHSRLVEGALARNAQFAAGLDETQIREAARILQRVLRNLMEDPFEAEKLLDYGRPAGARRTSQPSKAP